VKDKQLVNFIGNSRRKVKAKEEKGEKRKCGKR